LVAGPARSATKVREDGEHATVIILGVLETELHEDVGDVAFDGAR
jgi:hypothetical protein